MMPSREDIGMAIASIERKIYVPSDEDKQEDYLLWNSVFGLSGQDVLKTVEVCLKLGVRADRIREMIQGQ